MSSHIKLADCGTRLVHPWEGQRLGPKLLGKGHLRIKSKLYYSDGIIVAGTWDRICIETGPNIAGYALKIKDSVREL